MGGGASRARVSPLLLGDSRGSAATGGVGWRVSPSAAFAGGVGFAGGSATLTGEAVLSCASLGLVFIGSVDGAVYAVQTWSGAAAWRAAVGAPPTTLALSADGGSLFVAAGETALRLSAASGAAAWSAALPGAVFSVAPAALSGGTLLLVGCSVKLGPPPAKTGGLLALDADTGAVRWQRTDFGIKSSFAVAGDDSTVVAVTRLGDVVAVRAADGALLWRAGGAGGFYSPMFCSPTVDRGRVFFAAGNAYVHAFDVATGTSLWTTEWPGASAIALSPNGDTLVAAGGDDSALSFAAFDVATGERAGVGVTLPGISSGTAITVDASGAVGVAAENASTSAPVYIALDLAAGAVQWSRALPLDVPGQTVRPYVNIAPTLGAGAGGGAALVVADDNGMLTWLGAPPPPPPPPQDAGAAVGVPVLVVALAAATAGALAVAVAAAFFLVARRRAATSRRRRRVADWGAGAVAAAAVSTVNRARPIASLNSSSGSSSSVGAARAFSASRVL